MFVRAPFNCLLGLVAACFLTGNVSADDRVELGTLLDEFLAGASIGDVATHQRFWGEELVYTSSAGLRTNRDNILASMSASPAPDGPPAVVYTAKDVDIRLYDDIAIVAFELVGTPSDTTQRVQRYLNTGTFVRRDGEWKAIAWQATIKAANNE
ncbi:MAG: nuclear transport factor 2 family protein [Pseudomonadota bacterium]